MSRLGTLVRSFAEGFRRFGARIGLIVNMVLLSVVYLIGVGVTSVVAKLAGKRFFPAKMSSSKKTYWSELDKKKQPLERSYRQF
jgi:hypothetical protein